MCSHFVRNAFAFAGTLAGRLITGLYLFRVRYDSLFPATITLTSDAVHSMISSIRQQLQFKPKMQYVFCS